MESWRACNLILKREGSSSTQATKTGRTLNGVEENSSRKVSTTSGWAPLVDTRLLVGDHQCVPGEETAPDLVLPLLKRVAAKDARGKPCVGKCGTGGSGHYVKMIHNRIEHGIMSAQAGAWQITNLHLGMSYDEIGGVFAKWNTEGELARLESISLVVFGIDDGHRGERFLLKSARDNNGKLIIRTGLVLERSNTPPHSRSNPLRRRQRPHNLHRPPRQQKGQRNSRQPLPHRKRIFRRISRR